MFFSILNKHDFNQINIFNGSSTT